MKSSQSVLANILIILAISCSGFGYVKFPNRSRFESDVAQVNSHDVITSLEMDDYQDSENQKQQQGMSLLMGSKLVAPYADQTPEYRRVCVYPNWSILRESNMAKIYPEDIDPNLCTHIHYAYANIDVRTLQLSPSQYQDFNSGDHGAPLYERIMKLRQVNPNLKILISIGGWFAKSTPFNRILTNEVTRNTFIQNTLNFLRNWKFDGLDIQWEYPGDVEYGATSDSKQRFTSLIRNLRKAFKEEYKSTYRKYILTAFVPSDETRIDAGYQVKLVCRYLDYVSVATYDYTGPYDTKTGYNSPLYSRTHIQNSVNSSIYYWLERGCPSKKLLIGISTYARAFKIIKRSNSPSLVFVGIESEPFVSPSVYTSEEGILSYYEVCEMMSNKETRVYWDDLAEVPFAIVMNAAEQSSEKEEDEDDEDSETRHSKTRTSSSNLWISYEDARSARKKVEYAKQMQLGGVSIWSLDMDDFKGAFCNLGPFPIIEAIKEEFEHKVTLISEPRPEIDGGELEFEPESENESDNDDENQSEENATTERKTTKAKKPHVTEATKTTSTTKRVQAAHHTTTQSTTSKTNNKNNNQKKPPKTSPPSALATSSVASNNKQQTDATTALVSTSTRNRELEEQNEFDAFKNRLKKFKAVREIKLIACLDKKMCNINSSRRLSSSSHRTYLIYLSLLLFLSFFVQ